MQDRAQEPCQAGSGTGKKWSYTVRVPARALRPTAAAAAAGSAPARPRPQSGGANGVASSAAGCSHSSGRHAVGIRWRLSPKEVQAASHDRHPRRRSGGAIWGIARACAVAAGGSPPGSAGPFIEERVAEGMDISPHDRRAFRAPVCPDAEGVCDTPGRARASCSSRHHIRRFSDARAGRNAAAPLRSLRAIAPGAAKREFNGQQDAHRCDPPGGDPGRGRAREPGRRVRL